METTTNVKVKLWKNPNTNYFWANLWKNPICQWFWHCSEKPDILPEPNSSLARPWKSNWLQKTSMNFEIHLWNFWGKETSSGRYDYISSWKSMTKLTLVKDSEVDETTEHWPVESKFVGLLNDIKCTHHATPLHVFLNNKLVNALHANNILKGAVIEIWFELKHFSIQPKKIESFNASIQQIQILQPRESWPPTAFKWWDISKGPIQVSKSLDIIIENEEPPHH